MKKSEFEAQRSDYWTGCGVTVLHKVQEDIRAAEAAGVAWDPEEEPLPERLAITPNESYIGEFPDQDVTTWRFFFLLKHLDVDVHPDTLAVAREAVRRWNAWPELRRLAERFPLDVGRRHLLAILDGKEGE